MKNENEFKFGGQIAYEATLLIFLYIFITNLSTIPNFHNLISNRRI